MNRASLQAEITRFVQHGEGDFDTLATRIFLRQRENNPVLGRMFSDNPPAGYTTIPAVPVALFKSFDLGPHPPLPADRIFRTSGTTGQLRGTVRCRDTKLYDLAALKHFTSRVGDVPGHVISLCPTDPDSSLGHMVHHASGGTELSLFSTLGVDIHAWKCLRTTCFLASTAFALDALFAQPGSATLGPDSLVVVTGGFKGRTVRLDSASLYREIGVRLGNPRVVGEYGMTELSSQLWSDPVPAGEAPGEFVAPGWMRVYAVDPVSGQPVQGEGVLRFVDLCNLDSPVAIETEDIGRVRPSTNGDRVTLLGRIAGSDARGCSLRAEGFVQRAAP